MPEPLAVELEHEDKPEVKPEVKPESKEPQYVKIDELKKLSQQLNGISSALRTSEKEKKELKSKLEELDARLSGRTIKSSEAQNELDKLLEQGEWRTPVTTVARQVVEEILSQREQQRLSFEAQNEKTSVLETSKKQVRDKYPDIDDPNSDTAKAYIKVLNENPRYLKSEFGPLLAMRDMEDFLDSQNAEKTDKEFIRRARASASSLRPGNPAKSETIVLTKEQKDFCKTSGLDEAAYLKTLKSMSGREKEME